MEVGDWVGLEGGHEAGLGGVGGGGGGGGGGGVGDTGEWRWRWRWGTGWDFGNTSKTTALPGVCHHIPCRTTPLPGVPSNPAHDPGVAARGQTERS